MSTVKTLKLTRPEIDLLDYVLRAGSLESESQVLRVALAEYAARQGVPDTLLRLAAAARQSVRVRRCDKLARLMGRRNVPRAARAG